MARTKISEFSATPGDNTDIDGIDIAEGCAPSGINNAIRELMAQLKDMQTGASGDTFTLTTVNSTTVDTTNLEATNLKAKDGTAAGSIANSTGVVTLASSVLTTTDINGGTVDGTTIGATTPSTVVATQVDITAQGDLRLQDTTGGQYVALQAPGTIATSYTLTLPVDDGTSGQALITDGSGVLSWSTAASGDVYGPASATDNAVARFDLTTGKIIQNSAVTIADTTGDMTGVGTLSSGAITTTGVLTLPAGTVSAPALTTTGDTNTGIWFPAADTIAASTAGTERMRIDSAGRIGVGTSTLTGYGIRTAQNITGAVISQGIGLTATVQSDVTTSARGVWSNLGTQATAFSLNNLVHFYSQQGTIGAGSTVTNQFGFAADSGLTGATNNYGFHSSIASGTGRWNFYAAGTADNYFAGALGLGSVPIAGVVPLNIGYTLTGGTNVSNVRAIPTILSDVTSSAAIFRTQPYTQAAAFTLGNLTHYDATLGAIGATSAIANQYGFVAAASLIGATNNYGFLSNIASGTGRFNFYAGGTAANVFAGTTSIGGLVGSESLRVTPVASAVNYWQFYGAATGGSIAMYATGSDTNINVISVAKGSGFHFFNGSSATQFSIAPTASAVNYLQVTGAATGGSIAITAAGSDTNIGIRYIAKTAANHQFQTGGSAVNQFVVQHQASAVNYLQVAGAATGAAPSMSAVGSDTNIDLALTPKGTGVLAFGTYTAGVVVQAGYITIKDAAGNTRNLLVG